MKLSVDRDGKVECPLRSPTQVETCTACPLFVRFRERHGRLRVHCRAPVAGATKRTWSPPSLAR